MSEQYPRTGGPNFWVNTVSLEHVRLGEAGGFTQADHGRSTMLKRLSAGDGLVFYSPRTAMREGAPLQEFTALGRITGTQPYQVEMSADFRPWRLAVDFLEVRSAPVRPLVPDLAFIPDKQRWGFPFRRGLFGIGRRDFLRIGEAMGIDETSFPTSAGR
ncbi:MAG: EVE domain-containing protein [Actinomycetota bacterium]|nr:EVE domain-containing protein [Actinomycetota bacterium]